MNSDRDGISHAQRWMCLTAVVVGMALLLVFGPAMTAMAGPAQEKGQEETGEEKDKPKKYTNDDLKAAPRSSDSGREAVESGEGGVPPDVDGGEDQGDPAAEAADPWDSVGVATDSQGRGEAYWRQAMTEARAAVDNARKNRDMLQSELNRYRVDFTAIDDPAARALVHQRLEELHTQLAEAEQALDDAEQALRDLQEDARRSGALPGWLR